MKNLEFFADPVVFIFVALFALAVAGWVWWTFWGSKRQPGSNKQKEVEAGIAKTWDTLSSEEKATLAKNAGLARNLGNYAWKDIPETLQSKIEAMKAISKTEVESILGTGNIKCLCFRTIDGISVADFTTMPKPIGEMSQFDPSCPITGSGFIVKQLDNGEVVDYDPREVKFKVEESPEMAWFATQWDICKQVFFVPTEWFKSTAVWFAAASLVIAFITGLAVLG